MKTYDYHVHEFAPVYDQNSRILILGTFPSVKSRENHFYYGHPQNRFWKVLAGIVGTVVPESIEEKKEFLLNHGIAIWDVIASCEVIGSSDSSIKHVVPSDVQGLLEKTNIERVFANGNTAGKLYRKYVYDGTGKEITILPSTSPANAAYSLEKLTTIWGEKIQI